MVVRGESVDVHGVWLVESYRELHVMESGGVVCTYFVGMHWNIMSGIWVRSDSDARSPQFLCPIATDMS